MGNLWPVILMIALASNAQPLTHSELGLFLNRPPTALNQMLFTMQNQSVSATLPGSDSRVPISFSIVQSPTNGSVSGLDASTGAYGYQPSTNFSGQDFFTFKVTDSGNKSATASVSVLVLSTNAIPTNSTPTTNCIQILVSSQLQEGTVSAPGGVTTCVSYPGNYACQSGGTSHFTIPANTNGNVCIIMFTDCQNLNTIVVTNGTVAGSVGSSSLTTNGNVFTLTNSLNAFTVSTNVAFADYTAQSGSACSNLLVSGRIVYSFGGYTVTSERIWLTVNGTETNISLVTPINSGTTPFPYVTNFSVSVPVPISSVNTVRAWTSNYIGSSGFGASFLSVAFTNVLQ